MSISELRSAIVFSRRLDSAAKVDLVGFRASPAVKEEILAAAKLLGVSVSELMQFVCINGVRQLLEE